MSVGIVPTSGGGPALLDQTWVLGVPQGRNWQYQNGITAKASGTQANATQLLTGAFVYEVDTCATNGDSVKLFAALPGHAIVIENAGAATLDVYAYDGLNGAVGTSASDKINNVANGTAYTLTTFQVAMFICAKAGVWLAIKTA